MSQSVERAAAILTAVAAEPRTVAELAEEFGIHRSTMFRELQSLEQVGFVRRHADGRFVVGMRLAALGGAALEQLDLRGAAYAHVRRLHGIVGNTVHVAALLGDEIVYVDKVEDAGGMRMYSRVGASVRPYCSGIGKAVLAALPVERRDAVLADCDWRRYTANTLTSRTALDADLAVAARRGWAADDAEFEDFVACVAVPIVSSAGVVGALSITALRVAQSLAELEQRVPMLRETAAEISRELG
ncbi:MULTISPECIES: IclR family transcriptional regulator [unclassified Microbacterium]|uniref:IclR family transcriptional regulator n=1 Tax=unclassified Microbacterium TaxID=2609290 RepID=UPI0016012C2F|nr:MULTISPECIES: IclR family transcriptional regulator [unclassified Microbacterium]MBT2483597.1 IclR family transcriptional regulator [Microbacterium sp. ISL-108]